ncbi:MAG: replication factor C large subunit [Candidatus Lokiarchaeota archaeon]|nr:replication factor C large subunit [Candidatus Lokiarchaeota archaeon]
MSKKSESSIPWVEKYRPESIKEMALPVAKLERHRVDLAEELKNFIRNFFQAIEKINEQNKKIKAHNRTSPEKQQKKLLKLDSEKAAVLLEGPPGIGKTSIVYALANDLNMQVVETNASDTRTRDKLERLLQETTKSRGIMDFITETKKKLILIDEVDGIYGNQDRGAVPAIIDMVQDTQFPVIMCSNEYKSNLQSLYNKVKRFEVHPLSNEEIVRIAKKILKQENINNISQEDLELIIKKNSGDLRGVINDLQGVSQVADGSGSDNKDLIISLHRDTTEEIFSLIRDLFQKVSSLREAKWLTDKSDVDYNFLYKWINENLPTFITINEEIAQAYENLSLADEIYGRIRKDQNWSLLPYFFDLFAGGVALSRKKSPTTKGFRRVSFPRYTSNVAFSLTNTEKSIVNKIKTNYEISEVEVMQEFLPFLKILTGNSRRLLKEISDYFEFDAKEKKLLK